MRINGRHTRATLMSLAGVLAASSAHAATPLDGDALKQLINDKTVQVTRVKDGAKWRVYFAPDGKQITRGERSSEGKWWVDDAGKHCNDKGMLKCAQVVSNDDGTYARLKEDGKPLVVWSDIVQGNQL